ncbi:protein NUCLEAR FUSION DEFECTIVE 6, chloroplastic/mitochondrial [Sesamum indicum]|uniref:Protein NUCLEAR FUSION DEFECTIVE 6, chloroplastic/mitochondrial n=1 Tax=Sesamum indicum TaxID=4182 RepID=A0A6I9U7B6_SESIN|nr:protein NUCLEAR FUSION DEFECTIVE 6, chloroplastic/mitochondrial [Sesamum indicum]
MASSRIVARLSSRLQPFALKLNSQNTSVLSNNSSLLKSASQSAVNRRLSLISRLPVELSSLETMMPLHSAIASARLQSSLSLESQAWGLVPQGISMPL